MSIYDDQITPKIKKEIQNALNAYPPFYTDPWVPFLGSSKAYINIEGARNIRNDTLTKFFNYGYKFCDFFMKLQNQSKNLRNTTVSYGKKYFGFGFIKEKYSRKILNSNLKRIYLESFFQKNTPFLTTSNSQYSFFPLHFYKRDFVNNIFNDIKNKNLTPTNNVFSFFVHYKNQYNIIHNIGYYCNKTNVLNPISTWNYLPIIHEEKNISHPINIEFLYKTPYFYNMVTSKQKFYLSGDISNKQNINLPFICKKNLNSIKPFKNTHNSVQRMIVVSDKLLYPLNLNILYYKTNPVFHPTNVLYIHTLIGRVHGVRNYFNNNFIKISSSTTINGTLPKFNKLSNMNIIAGYKNDLITNNKIALYMTKDVKTLEVGRKYAIVTFIGERQYGRIYDKIDYS